MTLAVDPQALDAAGAAVISTGADIGGTLSTLTGALSGSAGMCGDDPVGAALGRSCDGTAQSLLTAMTAARNGLTNIGDGVRVSAYNYSRANASSDVSGRSEPLPVPTATGRITAATLPSSVGAGAGAPAGWGWVSKYIGMIWPNGEPDRLRAAAAAWTAAGTELLATELAVASPMGVVGAQQIPEAEAMVSAFGDSVRAASQVLAGCTSMAVQLSTYATRVETTQAAIVDLLARICDPMTGIKQVWDFLTQEDEDEIARIAADIKTVVGNLEDEASALAAEMTPAVAEAAVTVTDMTRWADKEWKHFLEDSVAGQQLNGMGQAVEGFGKQALDTVKDAWKYSPQRAVLDPEGSLADYKTLVGGMAPLVGLGGEGAAGVGESWLKVGKDTLHWDEWKENPAEALGRSLFDVATIFVPGGALTKGGKIGTGAAHAAEEAAATAPRSLGTAAHTSDDIPKPTAMPHVENPAVKPGEPVPLSRPGETPGPTVASKPTGPAPQLLDPSGSMAPKAAEVKSLSPIDTSSHPSFTEQRPALAASASRETATSGLTGHESADLLSKPGDLSDATSGAADGRHNAAPVGAHVPPVPEAVSPSDKLPHLGVDHVGGPSEGGEGKHRLGADDGHGNRSERLDSVQQHGAGDMSRIYSLSDGTWHATSFAPEQLLDTYRVSEVLGIHGVDKSDFIDLINKPTDSLTPSERNLLIDVRNAPPEPTRDTVMQKVIPPGYYDDGGRLAQSRADDYILGNNKNVVTDEVRGAVTVAGDTAHLTTPAQIHDGLRLDYAGSPFAPDDPGTHIIRFQADSRSAGFYEVPRKSDLGGSGLFDRWNEPFTGNGFTKAADDVIPEYIANYITMREGAEMWEVLNDGTHRLVAVLKDRKWIPQGN